ncbi:MAG TPA: DUF6134 family protein [Candidatus Obscuribacterales bacterium]
MSNNLQNTIVLAAGLSLFIGLPLSATVQASSKGAERRVYEVQIDKKPAGTYTLDLQDTSDGVDLQSRCDVDYRFLVFHYKYRYRGHEVWKGSKLNSFESDCLDDGKHISISVQPSANALSLSVNGKARTLPADVLTSSYWRLPLDRPPAGQFLEVDSGRVFKAQLEPAGSERLSIGDQSHQCKRFHVKGEDSGDLWYDEENRLVRQVSDSDGHATVVQLKEVHRTQE